MIYKTLDHKSVIFRVQDTFNIDYAAWKPRAKEWIGQALRLMRVPSILELAPVDGTVVNYKYELPCHFNNIVAIAYEGYRLPISIMDNMTDLSNIEDRLYNHPTDYYTPLGDGWIQTTFETGDIKLYYRRFPEDDNGMPRVPDNERVLEFLAWFILLRMIGRGYKHPIHTNYEKIEHKVMGNDNPRSLLARARNSASEYSIDERQQVSEILATIIPNNDAWHNESFDNSENIN